ncbi:MAG TPA: methyltransferase domain-containing protein [Solirubrobacteraceae bacterium]|jgi:ubiquinone/menaquinone biosynthesis C-methylase UbiE|nr:methyltransferase domain-containing protein [Solirubrobacteraceae bacterium]
MRPSADSDAHRGRVQDAFTRQAAAFEDRRYNRVFTADAAWLFDGLVLSGDELVLDVAAGTGHAARLLAPAVRAVIAVDATAEMLSRGCAAARAEGHANIVFATADAAALPFVDESFDLVVCRFALHHFEHPHGPLREMRRCLRPAGRLVVADLVASADPGIAAIQNELERRRDPSHARMVDAGELTRLIAGLGCEEVSVQSRTTERPLAPWLQQAGAEPDAAREIRRRLEAELDGGSVTGFAPRRVAGELWFTQTFAVCLATTPS